MIDVAFYELNKIRNSTAFPTGLPVRVYRCALKAPSSVTSPVIIIDERENGISINPIHVDLERKMLNYAVIEQFGRGYFVEDWVFSGTQIIATLSVDSLGSFWNQLQDKRFWIARASGQRPSGEQRWKISDAGMKMTGDTSTETNYFPSGNPFLFDYSYGGYVIGLINRDTNQIGAVSYYYFTTAGFKNLCNKLFDISSYNVESSDYMDSATFKAIYNPIQYVSSCTFVPYPIDPDTIGTSISSLSFGWETMTGVNGCYRINYALSQIEYVDRLLINQHPDIAGDRKKRYMMFDPYTTMKCVLQPFGTFAVDTTRIDDYTHLVCRVHYDIISGYAYLNINFGTSDSTDTQQAHLINTQCKISVDVQLAQIGRNNYAYQSAVSAAKLGNLNAQYQLSESDIIIGALTAYQQGVENQSVINKSNQQALIGGGISPHGLPYYDNQPYSGLQPTSNVADSATNVINGLGNVINAAANIAGAIGSGDISRVQSTMRGLIPTYDARLAAAKSAGLQTVAQAKAPIMERFGTNSGTIAFNRIPWYIEYIFYHAEQLDPDSYGFAYNEYHTLSEFEDPAFAPGKNFIYVQCEGAKIRPGSLRGLFPSEKDHIQSMLNTGFYIYRR